MSRHRFAIALSFVLAAACTGRLAPDGPDERPPITLMDGGPDVSPTTDGGAPLDRDASTPPPDDDAGAPPPPTGGLSEGNVFFVGHSLINFDMPAMLDGVADSGGVTHEYSAHIGNGASLSWIWNNPDRGEGDDPHAALPSGRHDVLVMTEAIPLADQVMWNDTVGYAGRFYDLAMAGDSGTRVYFYETWHSLDGGYDWRARIDSDRALWESVVDQVNASASGPDMLLIPGGTALGQLVDRVEAGGVPGLSSRRDLFADDIHLNDLGNYFIALVQYATIYRRSPVGVTASTIDRWGGAFTSPSPEAARVMQEIAWDVVSTDPRAGVR